MRLTEVIVTSFIIMSKSYVSIGGLHRLDYYVLDWYDTLVKQGVLVSTNNPNALDDFKLFYEELTSSKSISRIRRSRLAKK